MTIQKDGLILDMLKSELIDILGEQYVSISSVDKAVYSVDYFWLPRMLIDKGVYPCQPDIIVFPGTTEEVSAILKVANYYKIPVTTWGGGAGSQGGALAVYGGIVLDTKRLNKVIKIDAQSMTVTAETGIIQQHLEWEVNKYGYSTMHFPASITCSTLGGFLAHRGTGVLSNKYGKIEDMVVSLEVVLPNGDIINTLPVPRHAAGPDLTQLFVGSEGTLGVITKATMKIFPHPEVRRFRAFMFRNLSDALSAGQKAMTSCLIPAVIRLYDEPETKRYIHKVLGIEKEGNYMVFGFEGYKDIVEIEEKIVSNICRETALEELDPEMGHTWWKQRYDFFYPPHSLDLPKAYGTMDIVATYKDIEKVYWGMKETVENNFSAWDARFIAHFSHWYTWGCMCYDRFIIDNPPEDPHEALELHNQIWNSAIRSALKNGAVINEHHGVGLKLGRLMKEQYGSAFQVLQGIKKVLDPHEIMNPGKMGL